MENSFSNRIPTGAMLGHKFARAFFCRDYSSQIIAYDMMQDEEVVGTLRDSGAEHALLVKKRSYDCPGNGVTYLREGPILVVPGVKNSLILNRFTQKRTQDYEVRDRFLFGESRKRVK